MSICVYSATSVPASLFIASTEECGGVWGGHTQALEAEVLAPATESDSSPQNPLQVIQSDDSSPERRSMMSSKGWMWNGWKQLIWWGGDGGGHPNKNRWIFIPMRHFPPGDFSTESHELQIQGRITGLVTDRQTWKTGREREEHPFGTT